MRIEEASQILARKYSAAPDGEKVLSIHLFGIKYAEEIRDMSVKDIVARAELNKSYRTEVSKGIKLAKYVTVKS